MAKVVEVQLVAKTDGAVAGVNKVDQAVKKTAKTTKKASKELSGMQQVGGAVLGKLDQMTGGLASKLVAVGKAAKLSGKAMKTALISSGIGAAVVAVGLLVEHWDAIVDFVSDTNKELEKQIVLNNQNLDAVDLKLRNLKSQIELEKKQGKNVDALIEKEKALIKEKRDTLLKSIEDEKSALRKLEIETETLTIAERIRQGKKGISEITEEENEALIKQRQILSDLENKYTQFESSLIEDPKKTKPKDKDTSAADAEAAEKARIEAIERIRKGLIDTEAEERAEKLRLINEDYTEQIELAAKFYGTNSIKILELKAAQKKAEDEQQAEFAEQDKAKQDKIDQEAIDKEKKRLEDIQKIVNDATEFSEIQKLEREKAAALAELKLLEATWIEKARIAAYYENQIAGVKDKNADEDEKLAKLRTQQTLGDAKNTFNQIAQLAGEDSKVGKAMAIASATISGVQGVMNAYTTAQKSPITLGFPAYPTIQASLAGLVAAKNIAAIKSINPSGGGGGSIPTQSSGGGSTPPAFNVVGQSGETQLADAIGGQSQRPARAYVVSNDVTTAQEMDRNIIEGASI